MKYCSQIILQVILHLHYTKILRLDLDFVIQIFQSLLFFINSNQHQRHYCKSEITQNRTIFQKGVEIKTYYDIPSYQIHSDPNRIKQIIMTFLSNSFKFTEQGNFIISVQTLNADKSQHIKRSNTPQIIQYQKNITRKILQGKYYENFINKLVYTISVEDTGCGIPDNIKPQLFNLFATFSNQKIENKSGIGIGLMVCKNLVGLLVPSENIDLWSEQNVGTMMTCQIYAKLQDN
ncbi:unnamed protein product (macronuclear) [Paramecium tetraurelia]|uniref:Histidine kinase domain-containing protein n=1 Tax=Paramecium tetraurelia TaxID=5888 RepID=A0CIB1_PARTE|nr:uncharacterized protein GSPATT00007663001 [Paramecium tetraurelia]CAK70528.1 unnamed protein product [Paramecium tetraurelia]|eukprot:XP_001437925.1 hypothetical protein (macronuclear) [Paramecium tetraurelia strain d4-2]